MGDEAAKDVGDFTVDEVGNGEFFVAETVGITMGATCTHRLGWAGFWRLVTVDTNVLDVA